MLIKLLKITLMIGVVFMLNNCVSSPIPLGLYGNFKGTMHVFPEKIGSKVGKTCYTTFGIGGALPIFIIGDASVKTATENGGISKVSLVDFEQEYFLLGTYSRTCIVAYGE